MTRREGGRESRGLSQRSEKTYRVDHELGAAGPQGERPRHKASSLSDSAPSKPTLRSSREAALWVLRGGGAPGGLCPTSPPPPPPPQEAAPLLLHDSGDHKGLTVLFAFIPFCSAVKPGDWVRGDLKNWGVGSHCFLTQQSIPSEANPKPLK